MRPRNVKELSAGGKFIYRVARAEGHYLVADWTAEGPQLGSI